MIESLANIYAQAIEMIKIVTFIVTTIPLVYYLAKIFVKLIKVVFGKD